MKKPYAIIKNAPYPLRRFDTGASLDISKDGGAFAAATNAPTETPAAGGVYFNELTAIEMSADLIAYKGSTGDVRSDGFLVPEPAFDSGVAQAGSTTTITLRSGYAGTAAVGCLIEVVRGTGSEQQPRLITAYDSGTKVATVRPDWSTAPDNTSVYKITPLDKGNPMQLDGSAIALQYQSEFWRIAIKASTFITGSTQTILQTAYTGAGINPNRCAIMCLDGPNEGFCKPITAYNESTGEITISPGFDTAPANGERFSIFGVTG